MAVAATRIVAAALLEDDDRAFLAGLNELGRNQRTIDERGANCHFGAVTDHEDFLEGHGVAGFARELFDLEDIIGGNPVLLATGFDHCKHVLIRGFPTRTLIRALCGAAALPFYRSLCDAPNERRAASSSNFNKKQRPGQAGTRLCAAYAVKSGASQGRQEDKSRNPPLRRS